MFANMAKCLTSCVSGLSSDSTENPAFTGVSSANSSESPQAASADDTIGSLFASSADNCSPPKEKRDVKLSVLRYDAQEQLGINYDTLEPSKQIAFAYMYGKDLHTELLKVHSDVDIVKKKLELAMDPTAGEGKRLSAIMAKAGDTFYKTVPAGVQTFGDFLDKCPQWKCPSDNKIIINLFEDADCKATIKPFYRVQLSSLCYLHAVVLLKWYLVHIHYRNLDKHPMIDIAKYIRNEFSSEELCRHVFWEAGGSSVKMVDRLIRAHDGSEPETYSYGNGHLRSVGCDRWNVFAGLISEALRCYGPALVSNFTVTDTFLDLDISSHSGPITEPIDNTRKHAMLLVGVRIDKDDKAWFLLQNWWKEKQFVEVDYQWFLDSGAAITFVTTTPSAIEDLSYSQQDAGLSAEAHRKLDRADGYVPKASYTLEDTLG